METIKPILSQMSIPKPQLKFLLVLFSTIMILRGRMNYRNMSRYSILHEKSFSRNFKKLFDFTKLNHRFILETIPEENKKMAAIDASFVPKSGKINWYVNERLTKHLHRRSQRPYRPPQGLSFYRHYRKLGLIYLKLGQDVGTLRVPFGEI